MSRLQGPRRTLAKLLLQFGEVELLAGRTYTRQVLENAITAGLIEGTWREDWITVRLTAAGRALALRMATSSPPTESRTMRWPVGLWVEVGAAAERAQCSRVDWITSALRAALASRGTSKARAHRLRSANDA